MTLWTRLKIKWLTRKLERKQSAARGVLRKHPNPSFANKFPNGIHKK